MSHPQHGLDQQGRPYPPFRALDPGRGQGLDQRYGSASSAHPAVLSPAASGSQRDLPPLQPIPSRPTAPASGLSSILNPYPAASTYLGPEHPEVQAGQSISALYHTRTQTQQTQSYNQSVPSHSDVSSSSPHHGRRDVDQWTPRPPFSATGPKLASGIDDRRTESYDTAYKPYFGDPSRSSYTSHTSDEASQWHLDTHRRHSSLSSNRPKTSPALPRTTSQPMMMALQTVGGPIPIPVNTSSASRAADEKRRRNAGASARFRQRRKEKEQASNSAIDVLNQRINHLIEDIEHLRNERDYFARVVYDSPQRDQHFPRPPSPRLFRQAILPPSTSRTSSPTSAASYQESHAGEAATAYDPGRSVGESRSLPPMLGQPSQQPVVAEQSGYTPHTYQGYPVPPQQHYPSQPRQDQLQAPAYYDRDPSLYQGPPQQRDSEVAAQSLGDTKSAQGYPGLELAGGPRPPYT